MRRLPVLVACALALTACGGSSQPRSADGRLTVVTTVAPITSIVAAVAGDLANVRGLIPEGTNSHTFEPPPSAAKALQSADLVIINGLKLEDPTAELAERVKRRDAEVVELGTTALPEDQWIYDFSFPKKDGKPNPHLWTDPLFAMTYAREAATALARRDPAHAEAFSANADAFVAQATALSDALKHDQRSVARKELLTYHDGYAYFARDYGWTVLGAVQPRSFGEPTAKEVRRLIDQIRERHVPAIFGSEVFPSKVLEQIGRESGARYVDTLRDDDLPGAPGEAEHSWWGLMRFDFTTMVEALGGKATRLRALTAPTATDHATYPQ